MKQIRLIITTLITISFAACTQDIVSPDYTIYPDGSVVISPSVLEYPAPSLASKDSYYGNDAAEITDGSWRILLTSSKDTIISEIPSNLLPDEYIVVNNVPKGYYQLVLTNYATETGNVTENLMTNQVIEDEPNVVDEQYHGSTSFARTDADATSMVSVAALPQLAYVRVYYYTDELSNVSVHLFDDESVNLVPNKVYYSATGTDIPLEISATNMEGTVLPGFSEKISIKSSQVIDIIIRIDSEGTEGLAVTLEVDDSMNNGDNTDLYPTRPEN